MLFRSDLLGDPSPSSPIDFVVLFPVYSFGLESRPHQTSGECLQARIVAGCKGLQLGTAKELGCWGRRRWGSSEWRPESALLLVEARNAMDASTY